MIRNCSASSPPLTTGSATCAARTYSAANLGDFAGAMESYVKALQIREALVAAAPGDVQNRRDLAASYHKIGAQLLETSEAARGMEYLRKELAIHEQLAADQPENLEIRHDLAAAYNMLGLALEGSGDPPGRRKSIARRSQLREALVAADPGNQKLRRSLVITRHQSRAGPGPERRLPGRPCEQSEGAGDLRSAGGRESQQRRLPAPAGQHLPE